MKKTSNASLYTEKLTPEEISNRFLTALTERYWAEKALLELLPTLSRTATSYELITAINLHQKVTQHQIDRLIYIFDSLQERVVGSKYEVMEQLIVQAQAAIPSQAGFKRDSAIISACRNIMSHEIAIYENLIFYAHLLELSTVADYLAKAVSEERSARAQFSEIVLSDIYSEAG
ncbi:MAG: DUF892 family protein [Flavobacterium sp.]|uniref:DUF892 family protein n=1 Tax=Flavobacterium sp. TaxID=239 RepID=UPI00120A0EFC|nr:DUF892 family protein [Flavobacterium sp.]RZJ66388.1 MAG: DUF892 family protein [Flavobacterium sp.]